MNNIKNSHSETARVRFAPSPTGNVHIGNIRTAIFNFLTAGNCGGDFLLRIEDTDRERSTNEAINTLFESMKWLSISYNENVYYQSKHADEHIAAVNLSNCSLLCRYFN